MQLKKLSLTNFRVFQQAEFEFKPGMNLIVGVNGAGKSTVLDAIRIIFAQVLPQLTACPKTQLTLRPDDISIGKNALLAEMTFILGDIDFEYQALKPRQTYSQNTRLETPDDTFAYHLDRRERIRLRREKFTGFNQSEINELIPDDSNLLKKLKSSKEQPVAIFFSTRRSVPNGASPSKSTITGKQAAAYAEALSERELRWREFAEWWRAQEALGIEIPHKLRHINNLRKAVSLFLDNCTNLRVEIEELPEKIDKDGNPIRHEPSLHMLIDKETTSLDVRQLSDGERGLLTLILDIAKRLSLANPDLEDPLAYGKAVVLIDELDLHLHPGWQREVVQKLTGIFQKCQFIVTTHSPQIIGEVSPENTIIIESGQVLEPPHQSLGMDSNWILRRIMGANERNAEYKKQLEEIANLIVNRNFDQALSLIEIARQRYGIDEELVRLQTRIDRIKFLGR
jgi:predicted ATP-binding protein involved in virulence